ncbi:hypothetical protein SAMN03159463_01702 [Mesorhizobium sp. NFR06]|uniref:hypothetical protein n=1 Tax=Mesorhizobium sp. NFR06 TaxID=1566290 RepID=UPI0008EB28D8|nr:hypothetical protein [Mesorhizobium sp. NFR06]SFO34647.1 hypothetical protein SAMN03159463_01702 [Mesorhizobium sp. NFR06]
MNASDSNSTESPRNAEVLRIWADPACDFTGHQDFRGHQYGRRVEADRSWTVYHVFSGIPAHVDGAIMAGLSRAEATKRMLALNLRNSERQRQWSVARPFAREHSETPADRP